MSGFLDTLKERFTAAQRRFQVAQQNLQRAQQEFAFATQEYNSWQFTFQSEQKKEAQENVNASSAHGIEQPPVPIAAPASTPAPVNQVNKTDLIRQVLRERPTGISPTDMWHATQGQIKNRAYLYSVLKRLKDNEEVIERKGKYFLRSESKAQEENKERPLQVQ